MTQPREDRWRFNKVERKILQGVVDGKGYYKTETVGIDEDENDIISTLVRLYLGELISFQREYDIPFISESSRHQVKYKWYVVTLDKNMPLKNLKQLLKNGKIA